MFIRDNIIIVSRNNTFKNDDHCIFKIQFRIKPPDFVVKKKRKFRDAKNIHCLINHFN